MSGQKDADGQRAGWTGHLHHSVGAITPNDASTANNVFDPPLRGIMCTASGNVAVSLVDDDETDTATKVTLALTLGIPETRFAIRKIWSTLTTATGLTGYR